MKKFLCFVCAVATAVSVFASTPDKKESSLVFNPHWYLTVQGGASYMLHGNADFKDQLSPAAAIFAGYQFTPVVGLRLGVSGWQNKGAAITRGIKGTSLDSDIYKWNYVSVNLDLPIDLGNLFGGFRHDRVVNPYIFAGFGLNSAFNNEEAVALSREIDRNKRDPYWNLKYNDFSLEPWRGPYAFAALRLGFGFDFNLCDHMLLGVELNTNMLSDKYNSRHRYGKVDWQYNGVVNLKFRLGKNYRKVEAPSTPLPVEPQPEAAPVVPETTNDGQDTVGGGDTEVNSGAGDVVVKVEPFENAIYFTIGSSKIKAAEKSKVDDLVAYLNEHPDAKVVVCGYADSATGTDAINNRLSKERAETVASALKNKGIAADRIEVLSFGGVNENTDPALDRVVKSKAE